MSNTKAGPSAGNEPVRAPTTREVSPAARKLAEHIARRMGPMIQHAAQSNVPKPADDSEGKRLH